MSGPGTIGALRHRLSIERPERTGDAGGGAEVTWSVLATVWGAVEATGGAEDFAHERLESRVIHRIRIRHRDDLGAEMRLRLGARRFDIQALADPDGRGRWLDCLCVEER